MGASPRAPLTRTRSGASSTISTAVTSHTTSALCTSTFDNVSVSTVAPPPPPPTSSGPNEIVLYAMDYKAGEPLTIATQKAGIAMIAGAAKPPYASYDAFIGYDNILLGQTAAQKAADLIGCKGSVGTISVAGQNVADRVKGFSDEIVKLCPDVKVYDTAHHEGNADSGGKTLDAYMIAHPDLALIWWADGVSGQMAQAWKDYQAKGTKTLFMATDMPSSTLQAVKDGIFAVSIAQDSWTEEYFGLILAYNVRHGIRVPQDIYLRALVIDKSNVDRFLGK